MSIARAIPLIYEKSEQVKFPVSFEFALHRDLRVTCIGQCGLETVLELGNDYTVEGGGQGRSDCKSRVGSICLSCPKPDCAIVIEHIPDCVGIGRSLKALTRKEASQAVARLQSQIDALFHRQSLAPRMGLGFTKDLTELRQTEVGPVTDDGLWSPCAPVADDGAWYIEREEAFANDGKWSPYSPVSDDGVADLSSDCIGEDDGILEFDAPVYTLKAGIVFGEDDGDVSKYFGHNGLNVEVRNVQSFCG